MHIKTDGLVIKEQNTGESDRLITILTRNNGLIRAFVRGAKNIKSKNLSSTQLLCYSNFTFYKKKESYIVDSAEPIEVFFDLRNDIEKLSLALYFAQVAGELSPQDDEAQDFYTLTQIHYTCYAMKKEIHL